MWIEAAIALASEHRKRGREMARYLDDIITLHVWFNLFQTLLQ